MLNSRLKAEEGRKEENGDGRQETGSVERKAERGKREEERVKRKEGQFYEIADSYLFGLHIARTLNPEQSYETGVSLQFSSHIA